MANKARSFSESQITMGLRVYLESAGNCAEVARVVGCSKPAAQRWAKKGGWPELLEQQRREVEAAVVAEHAQRLTHLGEMRINLQYEALRYMGEKIQAWRQKPEAERGDFPFDPLRLSESMAKTMPAGETGPTKTYEEALAELLANG